MKKIVFHTVFLAIVACLLWSSAFVSIKVGLRYTTPLQFAGIRFILSGLYILPFCGNLIRSFKTIWLHRKTVMLIALFQTFLLYTFFYIGINKVPAAITAMVIGGSPLFISLLAHFMVENDQMNLRKTAIIILGISGVVIIALSREGDYSWSGGQEFWGIIILIIGNICGGVGNIFAAKKRTGLSPLLMNSAQLLTGGLWLFILSIPVEGIKLQIYPVTYYYSLAWLSFLSAIAFSIWFVLLQRPGVKVSELNIWKFIIPVFGAILAWVILPEEKPQPESIAGMVIISLSLVLLNIKRKFHNRL